MRALVLCDPRGRGGVLPYMVIKRVWVLHSSLELGMFLRRSYLFIIMDETINKSPS